MNPSLSLSQSTFFPALLQACPNHGFFTTPCTPAFTGPTAAMLNIFCTATQKFWSVKVDGACPFCSFTLNWCSSHRMSLIAPTTASEEGKGIFWYGMPSLAYTSCKVKE